MVTELWKCPRCIERGQPSNFGSPVRCAFLEDGTFTSDNWQCVTIGILRDLAEILGHDARDDGVSFGFVPVDGEFIAMSWYKSRGATGMAVVMYDRNVPKLLTLATADAAIAYHHTTLSKLSSEGTLHGN